ncbi:hypothetical protein GW17_00026359 [Ensete ventricosum]|nr:hypothetical protein GW17_00026359 [Ensete ventricosum]
MQALLPSGSAALRGRYRCRSGCPRHEVAPYDLAAGNCPLRPGRGRCLCPLEPPLQAPAMPPGDDCPCKGLWPWLAAPLQGALAAAGCPHTAGLVVLFPYCLCCENVAITR